MKKIIVFACYLLIFLQSIVFSHWWRTDSKWGHNCRTWSCAWTYHYHNWWYIPKPVQRVVTCSSNQCKLWNICFTKPANAYCVWYWWQARACNNWYKESWNYCVKEYTAPTKKTAPTNNNSYSANNIITTKPSEKVISCLANQCKLWEVCYTKPSNAYCTWYWWNARACNDWYTESWWSCVKEYTAPIEKTNTYSSNSIATNTSKNNDSWWGWRAWTTLGLWWLYIYEKYIRK